MKNKKRQTLKIFFALFTTVLLLCSAVVVASAVSCNDHLWTSAGVCDRCGEECQHDFSPWGQCYICSIHVCSDNTVDSYGNCLGCLKHYKHVYDGYGVCKGCPWECQHSNHAPNEFTYCYDCNLQDDERNIVPYMHVYNLLGVCTRCNYAHEHENVQNWTNDGEIGYCKGCGALCLHVFTEGECDICALECPHSTYQGGYCALCESPCPSHRWERFEDSSSMECTICGAFCSHYDLTTIYIDADEYGHYIFQECNWCGYLTDLGAEHHESNGIKCTLCDRVCSHNFGDSKQGDQCIYCGFLCFHEQGTVFDNVLSNSLCGYVEKCVICSLEMNRDVSMHTFDADDICERCGKLCIHSYSAGACIYCERQCMHSFSNGSIMCTICGYCVEGPTETGSLAFDLILSIFDAEVTVFYSLLNYSILGINVATFAGSLIVLAVVIFIIKKVSL